LLVSTVDIGIAITDLVAFRSGFTCCLRAERRIARYGDAWLSGLSNPARENPMIDLMVRFADGSVAHNADAFPPSGIVSSPIIVPIGGEGSDPWRMVTYYWVSPLPTSGAVTFSIRSQILSLPEASQALDAQAFVASADRALPIWQSVNGP
jgi:hypothetical protein